ncbi:MAG: tyrosine-type recombinase/integrase [Hungatella hathewayi]|nr:tyrosine-type recombinase/integrase [Hungatella hathewayi]
MNKRKNLTISKEMLPAYREYLQDEERSRATVEKYLRDVRVFLEYVGENQVLGKERIREYKEELRERYKISSANSMLAAVNSFLVFLGREEMKVKLFKVQKVLYSRPEREMTEKDYEKLVRTARRCGDLSMSMLLQTIGSTGIRISELRFITVESLEVGRAEIYNKGKSRVVLLPVELSRMLKKYCREAGILTGSIFVTKHGNPVDRSNVSKKMKQLAREAGVDENRVFPHNFRHLFARIFYSVEKDVVRLMDLLGHASISTTRIYTMTTEDQPRRQMSRMRMVLG